MRSVVHRSIPSSPLPTHRHLVAPGYWKTLSVEELIESCREGGHAAFDEFRRRYDRLVFRMAWRLTGNSSDAEDIAQEAFIRIYQGLASFQNIATLPAWIHRIVGNLHINRHRSRLPWLTMSLQSLSVGGREMLLSIPDRDAPSPQTCAEVSERESIIQEAVSGLPDFHRRPIALYYFEERSYEEISQVMQIPIGTVRSRLHRARLAMRKSLDSQENRACLLAA